MPADGSCRVSILIPNFNNGRESSHSGKDDLLGNLLRSLQQTLKDDKTSFEIIAYDDGSTDDSLETLREWSRKRWPNGRSFLELIEAPHCGYLSRTANILCQRARGQFLVRLDGDIICLTPNWVTRLCEIFDRSPPELGVVAPKQLRADGMIHAFGDFVLHPKGYSHVASAMPRDSVRHPMQVDHAMGCFHCMKRTAYDQVGGYDENFLRGQTEDLGLRALLKGWGCIAVPQIEFMHLHMLRKDRDTEADSQDGIQKTLRIFEDKWGFSRLAPDLDEVWRRYADTPLLWNPRVFGPNGVVTSASPAAPPRLEETEWGRYASDLTLQKKVNTRLGIICDVVRQSATPQKMVVLGAGQGLLLHLLATKGLPALGLETSLANVALARRCIAGQNYGEAGPPRFEHQRDPRRIPLADGEADLIIIVEQMETHPNPVQMLKEAQRVLAAGRLMAVFSQRRSREVVDPSDPSLPFDAAEDRRYLWLELLNQIQAVRGWELLINPKADDRSREMVVVARRDGEAAETTLVGFTGAAAPAGDAVSGAV